MDRKMGSLVGGKIYTPLVKQKDHLVFWLSSLDFVSRPFFKRRDGE